jgi:hypothetical protein
VNEALDNLTFTDTTPSAFLGEYITEKVSTTDGGIERILTYFTILSATASKAGLLSAADKAKLDAILGNLRSLEIDDTTAYADLGDKIVESIKATIGGTEETISTFQLLAATASKAGLLSAADKAKLDALWSSGYQFAGIATPSATPISTTSKIFYIATEAGTYFNAVTVTQGINILSWDGSAWSAVQVIGIDSEPTADSGNLVESGGVAKTALPANTMMVRKPDSVIYGSYINHYGEQSENSKYNIQIYAVTPGDHLVFGGKLSPNNNFYYIHWFDSNEDYLSNESYSGLGSEYINQPITVPNGAAYLYFNIDKAQLGSYYVANFDLSLLHTIDDTPTENSRYAVKSGGVYSSIKGVRDMTFPMFRHLVLQPFETEDGKVVSSSGVIGDNSAFCILKYNVKQNRMYSFSGRLTDRNFYYIHWFEEDGTYISHEAYKGPDSSYNGIEIKSPPHAAFLYLNVQKVNFEYYAVFPENNNTGVDVDASVEIASEVMNKYINSSGVWQTPAREDMVCFFVDVSNANGSYITQIKRTSAQYAFVKEYDENGVTFADGCERESGRVDETLVPLDANYLYVYISHWEGEEDVLPDYLLTSPSYIGSMGDMYVSKSSSQISVYRKLYGNIFVKFPFIHAQAEYTPNTYPSFYDNWGLRALSVWSLGGDGNTQIENIFRDGEAELAISVPRGDGESGYVYVGGSAHGFENIIEDEDGRRITIFIDNQKIGETDEIDMKPASKIEIIQESYIVQSYTNSDPWAKAIKHWIIDKNKVEIHVEFEILRQLFLDKCKTAMFCSFRHGNGNTSYKYLTSRAIKGNHPYKVYEIEDGWTEDSANTPLRSKDSGCRSITLYGEKGMGFRMEIDDSSTTLSGAGMNVTTNSSTYNKIYYSPGEDITPVVGTVIQTTQKWSITSGKFIED